jgi:hypothetical protein
MNSDVQFHSGSSGEYVVVLTDRRMFYGQAGAQHVTEVITFDSQIRLSTPQVILSF